MATYYVDSAAAADTANGTSTATPWKTLSATRIAALKPGDVVRFKNGGTYKGNYIIPTTVNGTAASKITFNRYGVVAPYADEEASPKPRFIEASTTLADGSGARNEGIGQWTLQGSYCVIDGFEVNHTDAYNGMYPGKAADFTNYTRYNTLGDSSSGVLWGPLTQPTSERWGRVMVGIAVTGHHNEVKNCYVTGCENGIRLNGDNASYNWVHHNRMVDNIRMTVANAEDYGAYSLHLASNTAGANASGPHHNEIGPGNICSGARAHSVKYKYDGAAFESYRCHDNLWWGNLGYNCDSAIEIAGGINDTYAFMVFEGPHWTHLQTWPQGGPYAKGLKFYNCILTNTSGNCFGCSAGGPTDAMVFRNTHFEAPSNGGVLYNGGGAAQVNIAYCSSNKAISGNATFGAGNKGSVNAQFVDKANHDWRILTASPLKDSGTGLTLTSPVRGQIKADFYGGEVGTAGTPDIGIHEFGATGASEPTDPGGGGGTTPPPTGALVATLGLDKASYAVGETITGLGTLTASGGDASYNQAVITFRKPGAASTYFAGSNFTPSAGSGTASPGSPVTWSATNTIPADGPNGTWTAFATWQDASGVWHDGTSVSFTVTGAGGGTTPPPATSGTITEPTPKVEAKLDAAGTTLTWARPDVASIAVGDYLVWQVYLSGTSTVTTAPAGSSHQAANTVTQGAGRLETYYLKVTDPNALPASFSLVASASADHIGVQLHRRGVDPTTPFTGTPTKYNAIPSVAPYNPAIPDFTPGADNAEVIVVAANQQGDATGADSWAPPANYSEISDLNTGTASSDRNMAIFHRVLTGGSGTAQSGLSPVNNTGFGSDDTVGLAYALNAAPASTAAAPEVTLTSAPGNLATINTATPTFAFTLTATGTAERRVDGGAWTTVTSPYTTTTLSQGQHTVEFRAKNASNTYGGTVARTFTVDTISPSLNIGAAPAQGPTSQLPQILVGTDETSKIEYRINGGAWTTLVATFVPSSPRVAVPLDSVTRVHGQTLTVELRATDVAGNVQTSSAMTWTFDLVLPDITIVSGPAGTISTNTPSFTVSATENGALAYSLDNGNFITVTGSYVAGTNYNYTMPALSDGSHKVQWRIFDAAGNGRIASGATFTVQSVAPAVTILSGPAVNEVITDATPNFSVSLTAGYTLQASVDGGAYADVAGTSWTPDANLSDGQHTVSFRGKDSGGAFSGETTRTFFIDTSGPVLTVTSGPGHGTTVGSDSVTYVVASETNTSFEYRINNGAWESFSGMVTKEGLPNGNYTFDFRGIDERGLVGPTLTRTVTITVVVVGGTIYDRDPQIDPTLVIRTQKNHLGQVLVVTAATVTIDASSGWVLDNIFATRPNGQIVRAYTRR